MACFFPAISNIPGTNQSINSPTVSKLSLISLSRRRKAPIRTQADLVTAARTCSLSLSCRRRCGEVRPKKTLVAYSFSTERRQRAERREELAHVSGSLSANNLGRVCDASSTPTPSTPTDWLASFARLRVCATKYRRARLRANPENETLVSFVLFCRRRRRRRPHY